jgi:protein-S-isoprenylcysteine O-methyltransferase Ste14
VAAVALFVIRYIIGRHYYLKPTRGTGRAALDTGFTFLMVAGQFYVPPFYAFTRLLDSANYQVPVWVSVVGALLLAAGCYLILRGQVDLGRSWSPKVEFRPDQALVTNGIYSYVRHPMYAGFFIWSFAQPLLIHNWIAGFGFLIVFTPMFLYRAPLEEKLMLDQFGDEYRRYQARTGSVIPLLWRRSSGDPAKDR